MDIREIIEGFISIYYHKGHSGYLRFLIQTLIHLPYFSPKRFFGEVSELQEKFDARLTFFVLGKIAGGRKEYLLALERDGHEIASHSYNHYSSMSLSDGQFEKELSRSLDALSFLQNRPVGYRSPHLFFKDSHYPILARNGFTYSSSQFNATNRKRKLLPNLVECPVNFMDCHFLGDLEMMMKGFSATLSAGGICALHPYIALHPKYRPSLYSILEVSELPIIPIREQMAGKQGLALTFDIGF